jgi:AcrR family transcriptional regulator
MPRGRSIDLVSDSLASTDRRAKRRANRREQSRIEILDAAERVFGEFGIHDGTLRRIALQSGFSPAAVYLFFENKQHLLAETVMRRSDELIAMAQDPIYSDLSPLDRLHSYVDRAITFFSEHPHFRLLLRHLRGGPTITWPVLAEYSEPVHARYLASMDNLASIIREGQVVGQIRSGNGHALAHLYTMLINEFILLEAAPDGPGFGTLSSGEFHNLIDGALRTP